MQKGKTTTMTNTSINSRIEAVKKCFFKTYVEFGDAIGKSRQFVTNITKEGYSVSLPTLELIGKNIPELDLGWLITGRGDMLKRANNTIRNMQINKNGVRFFELSNNLFTIQAPFVSAIDYDRLLEEYRNFKTPNFSQWTKGFFINDSISNNNYMGFEVQGNAMSSNDSKSLLHGDVVLTEEIDIDSINEAIYASFKPFWVIVHHDGIFCRQIDFKLANKGILKCIALRQSLEFPELELEIKDVLRLFNVVQKVTSVS